MVLMSWSAMFAISEKCHSHTARQEPYIECADRHFLAYRNNNDLHHHVDQHDRDAEDPSVAHGLDIVEKTIMKMAKAEIGNTHMATNTSTLSAGDVHQFMNLPHACLTPYLLLC